jgi:hypothetical protein
MTTAQAANGTATQAKGWGTLPCIVCGEAQATIHLDLTDCESFHYADCDNDFTADDVRAFLAQWQKVLAWCERAAGA